MRAIRVFSDNWTIRSIVKVSGLAGAGLLAAVLASSGGCASSSSTGDFAGGDGVIVAPTGASAFEMQFDPISLGVDSDRTFEFDHVPATDMHMLLVMNETGEEAARRLDRAGVSVRAELVGMAGGAQADTYTLRDGPLEGVWVRSARGGEPGVYDYLGMVFKARRHERFALTLRVRVARAGELQGFEPLATPLIRGGHPLHVTPMHRGSESVGSP